MLAPGPLPKEARHNKQPGDACHPQNPQQCQRQSTEVLRVPGLRAGALLSPCAHKPLWKALQVTGSPKRREQRTRLSAVSSGSSCTTQYG